VKKAIKCTKPRGLIFLSASLRFPQSKIEATQLVGDASGSMHIQDHGYLPIGGMVGNQFAYSTRYYLFGNKKTRKEMESNKQPGKGTSKKKKK